MNPQAIRQAAPVAASALLLAGAIFTWPALYLFAKVMFLPAWAEPLPDPFVASWGVAAIAMLPLWLGPGRATAVVARFGTATITGAVVGVLAWAMAKGGDSPANLMFHVLWAWALHLLPPAALMVLLRAAAHALPGVRRAA